MWSAVRLQPGFQDQLPFPHEAYARSWAHDAGAVTGRSTAKDASQGRAPDVKEFDQDTAEDLAARVSGVLQVCAA
jgi:hypothetical protein